MTAAIDKLRQLDDDELDALIELAQARANSEMSKRDFLKAAGVLGAGAALGGGGAAALTGDAKAAASTTDGDGDIGTPDNPEDVFADALAVFDGAQNQIGSFDETGIETPSVDTEQATIGNHNLINGFEFGVVSISDVPAASDSSTDTVGSKSVSISFNEPFDSSPLVLVSTNAGAQYLNVGVFDETTNGCEISAYNLSTSAETVIVVWLAVN
jgi:hypothetical protein